jgi:hypothetical protein
MDVCLLCVLSGRGLCDELITRPEDLYRLWRVVCDQALGCGSRKKNPTANKAAHRGIIKQQGLNHQCNFTRANSYSVTIRNMNVQRRVVLNNSHLAAHISETYFRVRRYFKLMN